MKTILAIDPGKHGAIAVHFNHSAIVDKMPETISEIAEHLHAIQVGSEDGVIAIIEAVPKFTGPLLPGSVIFVMAENFGAIQGILAALKIQTILVHPRTWQKTFNLGTKSACKGKTNNQKRTEWKRKLKGEAQRRYPDLKIIEDTADAVLILDWAKRQNL